MSRFAIVFAAAALILTLATDGSAQPVTPRFENVRFVVKVDEVITVRVVNGQTRKGRVKGQPQRLEAQDVSMISHRVSDSLWNGALVAGFTPAVIAAGFTHELGTGTAVKAGLIWGGAFGALGAGVDALFRKREVVYQAGRTARVGFVPLWDRRRHGFAASVRF